MGKVALFAIAAFSIMTGYYSLSTQSSMVTASGTVSESQYEVLARNAALSGYNMAKEQLIADFNNTTRINGFYEDASYLVYIYNQGASGEIRYVKSMGQAFLPDNGVVTYYVHAHFIQGSGTGTAEEVPAFMKYALLSNGDMTLGGDLSVDTVTVEGTEATEYNANVHSNGTLKSSGNAAKIKGFGTFKKNENVTHEKVFQPLNNPAREKSVKQVAESVDVPNDFSIDGMAAEINQHYGGADRTETGNYTLEGTYDFTALGGTREDPYVFVIEGDLNNVGNVEIKGHVMFLVKGNISFSGNIKQGDKKDGESHAAFYTEGSIDISGDSNMLQAQMFAKQDVTLSGNPTIYGNVAAGGTLGVSGKPKVKYYPASPALTKIWNDVEPVLKLISYSEI